MTKQKFMITSRHGRPPGIHMMKRLKKSFSGKQFSKTHIAICFNLISSVDAQPYILLCLVCYWNVPSLFQVALTRVLQLFHSNWWLFIATNLACATQFTKLHWGVILHFIQTQWDSLRYKTVYRYFFELLLCLLVNCNLIWNKGKF